MKELLFGTAGIPIVSKDRSTEGGIREIKRLGLSSMEIEFVRGVRMTESKAKEVNKVAKDLKIALTVHGPYFINLNSKEEDKLEASKQRILDSCRIGYIAGAKSVTFHAAYYGGDDPKVVYERVKEYLTDIAKILEDEGISIDIRPETTGKLSQFGSLDEVISLSKEIPSVKPCIDFAHIYGREMGKYNTYDEFMEILDKVEGNLGKEALKDMHIHVSGMDYGPKGEKKHLTLDESAFKYKDLLKALKDRECAGFLISESPILEEDALLMKDIYEKL